MQDSIQTAAALTFEDLAFLLPLETEPEEMPAAEQLKSVSVDFTGPLHGRVIVTVSHGILPALAMNMLGEDEEDVNMQMDALRECANVICGNVLPKLTNDKDIYKLAAPVEVPVPTIDQELGKFARARFAFEEGFGEVLLLIDKDAA